MSKDKEIKEKKPKEQFVTMDMLNDFGKNLLEAIKETKAVAPDVAAANNAAQVESAGPTARNPVVPEWKEAAEELLGDAMEYCEVDYRKDGGVIFTVVIKAEKSNAPKEYLTRYHRDARSKEVSRTGLEGVTQWCKLIKQNLARKK